MTLEQSEERTSMIRRMVLAFTVVSVSPVWFALAYSQGDLHIWKEFIHAVKTGTITADDIRPHKQLGGEFKKVLLGYLDSMRTQATPEDWTAEPEIIRINNRMQCIVPWTTRGQKISYCLSFVNEDSQWYFQHLEAVFIRLDTISHLPVSDFPDVSEDTKHWVREEIYWSFVVINLYLPVAREKGIEYALALLKDGGGYFLSGSAWVPFAPPHKAFILYLCWEQAKLRGNDVKLVKLEDDEAIVQLNSQFFALYSTAAHLKPLITFEDYKRIFETIWQDRAFNAGWALRIQYTEDSRVTFHFKRSG